MKNLHQVIDCPLVTEKSSLLSTDDSEKVVLKVHVHANKIEIKKAVEKYFKVSVVSVNTMHYKGKPKRVGRNYGRASQWKKAVVSLKKGDKIELIEGV